MSPLLALLLAALPALATAPESAEDALLDGDPGASRPDDAPVGSRWPSACLAWWGCVAENEVCALVYGGGSVTDAGSAPLAMLTQARMIEPHLQLL